MKLQDLVSLSAKLKEIPGRKAKIALLAEFLKGSAAEEGALAVSYLQGKIPQGKLGAGWRSIKRALEEPHAPGNPLSIRELDDVFEKMSSLGGKGSQKARVELLSEIARRASKDERGFLVGLLFGEVRHGAGEGVIKDALAKALELSPKTVNRALMFRGDLGEVARIGFTKGRKAVERIAPRIFSPVKPMLAQPVDDLDVALETLGEAAFEFKFDGARVQVHKSGDEVRIYSRHLNDVSESLPEIQKLVRTFEPRELILEGEALVLDDRGRPLRFQDFMRRFRRKNLEGELGSLPVQVFFFDLIFEDGGPLFDLPYKERFKALESAVREKGTVAPRVVTGNLERAREFFDHATRSGHEGLLAKSLGSGYMFGARGKEWLKIKRTETLDLLVVAADWGYGRREGWLSNYHLACRKDAPDKTLILGKTYKGLTDEEFRWMTKKLLSLEVRGDRHTVYVKPEVVVEVAFNEIQRSRHYDSGFALRFARIKRIRTDKSSHEIDTIERVRDLYEEQFRSKGKL
jgi:DNA ligase-1